TTVSCTKKGDPGPSGTNGTNGTNGTDGTDGAPGADGNTLYISDTIHLIDTDFESGYWTVPTAGGGSLGHAARVATIEVDTITQRIFESGIVVVYLKNSSNFTSFNQWMQLPFQIGGFTGGYDINVTFGFDEGHLRIYYFFVKTDAVATVPNVYTIEVPTLDLRYVILPGSGGFGVAPPARFMDDASMKNYFRVR
ncbi:MAG TPA: hypothetical protein VK625_09080, partial [Flavitalea sp.]|nr:hypothetical protein [Flavitalea sp.]